MQELHTVLTISISESHILSELCLKMSLVQELWMENRKQTALWFGLHRVQTKGEGNKPYAQGGKATSYSVLACTGPAKRNLL